MVDYSKWDRLDDDSDVEDEAPRRPHVQRFDGPQTVTIGGSGYAAAGASTAAVSSENVESVANANGAADADEPMEPADEDIELDGDHREDVLQCRALAERALRRGDPAEAVRLLQKAMRMGGSQCPGLEDVLRSAQAQAAATQVVGTCIDAHGGAEEELPQGGSKALQLGEGSGGIVADRYSWSQLRETVEVKVFLPLGTKAKNVTVMVTETSVDIRANGVSVLAGEWEFKVAPEEDPDWELTDAGGSDGRRAVRLTVRKGAMPGGLSVVVWWKRLLKGDPCIDVSAIPGRKKEASESFAKAWGEAHTLFREKVKQREKIVIEKDGSVLEDEAAAGDK
eukprot:TRINITY_DN73757_c0_g1_i1.p1 TRINITY_DN73757_c0_g1~~TRINITY_DN73757_c0_g1_i1.p1  ORF type:complete len:361 (-),score=81.76 TRINITY_DN73757_c0_g1_i1:67-1080(-)